MLRALIILVLWSIVLLLITEVFAGSRSDDWRLSALKASTIFGILVWISCEILSAFNQLTFGGLSAFWISCILVLWMIVRKRTRVAPEKKSFAPFRTLQICLTNTKLSQLLPLIYIGTTIIVLLLIALQAAPNNWDSMTYHLSRVVHWQQQNSIRFYPTNNLRQLHSGPWAEMAILHLQVLTGNDRLSNLVQWVAMIGSLIGVSYIVKILGGSRLSQVMAVLMAATIPMGILQSTSTQNDYVVALWLCCFTVFSLTIIDNHYQQSTLITLYIFAGSSLGLAVLTKPIALIYAFPLILWLDLDLVRKNWRYAWKPALAIGVMVLLINSGQFTRNYLLFGSPLGPSSESTDGNTFKYTNDMYNASVMISNLLRNSAIHLSTPNTQFNEIVQKSIQRVHNLIKMDINDPRTTWTGAEFTVGFSIHEDLAGNPIHFVLIGFSLLLLIRSKEPRVIIIGMCAVAGFILFSLLLKWQPWNSRLHLPLFVLSSTFSAIVITKSLPRGLVILIAVALTVWSIPYIIINPSRPLIGPGSVFIKDRISQYFSNRPDIAQPYKMAADWVRNSNCKDIGLILGSDDWEYPFWVITGASSGERRIENIAVGNPSVGLSKGFTPCVIITTSPKPEPKIIFQGITYSRMLNDAPVAVFLSQSLPIP